MGAFNQSGGTSSASTVYVGPFTPGYSGTFNLSGGSATIDRVFVGATSGSPGVLTVTGTGVLTLSDLTIYNKPGTSVNLNGGTINVSRLLFFSGVPSLFNWTSGTLNMIEDVAWDSAAAPESTSTAFGSSLTLGANQKLLITGNDFLMIAGNETLGGGGGFSLPLNGGSTHNVAGSITINPTGALTLNGGTLTTGGLVNNGTFLFNSGTLGITGAGGLTLGAGGLFGSALTLGAGKTLNVANTTTINSGAILAIESGANYSSGTTANSGTVFLGGATAIVGGTTFNNTGLVRGEGLIKATFNNSAGGEIRIENGKLLSFDGPTTRNAGNITLFGGAATFAQAFTNGSTGKVTGHGGLIFNGGFTNQGPMQFSSGGTDIYGAVTNSSSGSIITGSGSITTFYNDVIHSGSQIRTAAGGFTVFFGNVHGADSFTGPGTVDFEGTYTPGNLGGNVSFASNVILGNSAAIIMNDGGTTEITGVPTLNSGSSIQLNNGTLRFNVNSGAATIATGLTATVNNAATLELAGSVSALSSGINRVNILNSSAAPGILVIGKNQQVGNIDGSGTTQVNAGSDLTANHIIQNALIIGGTSKNPGLVTIDASDASGNPLGQSSGLALAGSLTPSGPIGAADTSFASLSTATTDNTDLAVPAAGNSVGIGNASQVPEPSTLLLALLAVLSVISTQFARRHFRYQTV